MILVKPIKIIGIDPSLRNTGIAVMQMDNKKLSLLDCNIISTKKTKGLVNNSDFLSAQFIYNYLGKYNADLFFIELPTGSQSARAMASYGICIGIFAALSATKNMHIVTPNQVKKVTNIKNASKQDIINWVLNNYHNAKDLLPKNNKKEHACDAICAVHAGLKNLSII